MAEKTLTTDKDAYVDEASPDTEMGGGANLYVRSQGGALGDGDRRVLVSFDVVGDLPSDAAEVTDAVLRLTPQEKSTLDRDLRCEEVTGSWQETQVTWNNQPSVDADEGLESSGDDPHEWNVTGSVQEAFDASERAELRVKDDAGGSPDGPQQEYSSREGDGQTPELVVTFKKEATSDLSSTITVSKNQFEDLDSAITARTRETRYEGFRAVALDNDENGDSVSPVDLVHDTGRDVLWVVAESVRVYKYATDGTLKDEFLFDADSSLGGVEGIAYDGTDLWMTDRNRIERHSIQSDGVTFEESFDVEHRESLAWDSGLWASDPVSDKVYKHNDDSTLSVASEFDQADVHGLAIIDGDSSLFLLEGTDDMTIVERATSDLSKTDAWDHSGDQDAEGLAFLDDILEAPLWAGAPSNDGLELFSSLEIASTVDVGREFGTSDLSSSVQPSNVSGEADLDSQVAVGAQAHLSSQVTAKENTEADLDASVESREAGDADINSTIEPGTDQIDHLGRATGRVNPVRVFTDADVQEISAQAGSTIDWTKKPGTADERTVSVRRVVQLVGAAQGKNYPRERTSHQDRTVDTAALERGDAVLYALPGDAFQPGDTVDWQDRSWEVVGLLGWERVGDENIYQEVGLRRLATTHLARAKGSVQREDDSDILAWIDVNVP